MPAPALTAPSSAPRNTGKALQVKLYRSYGSDGQIHVRGRVMEPEEHKPFNEDDSSLTNLLRNLGGMSVDEVPIVLGLIERLKADAQKIVLLVEHKMDVVRSLADRIIVLHNGQLVADGRPAEVIASPIVQEAYLGVARERRA